MNLVFILTITYELTVLVVAYVLTVCVDLTNHDYHRSKLLCLKNPVLFYLTSDRARKKWIGWTKPLILSSNPKPWLALELGEVTPEMTDIVRHTYN